MASTSAGASPHTCSRHPGPDARDQNQHQTARTAGLPKVEATMYEIQHLIDGQAAGSTSGQRRSGLRSGHRRADSPGGPGLGGRSGRCGRLGPFGVHRVGRGLPGSPYQAHAGVPEPGGGQRRGGRDAAHGRARQGPGRCPWRGGPRHREHRVRLRVGRRPEGDAQRTGQQRRRRVHGAPAPGRRCRHHAVQLPGNGPRSGCSPMPWPVATPSS